MYNRIKWDYPYLSLDSLLYEAVRPTPLDQPYLIDRNDAYCESIGLPLYDDESTVGWINGESDVPTKTYATAYAGFQFGHYVPLLGDGRAIHYGTLNGVHLQTKGSGQTPFSRGADGRTTLFSSMREYLASEALHALGIPTIRCVGLIGSQTEVVRSSIVKAAVVMRASRSWVRFGTFEYLYYMRAYDELETLMEYVIQESYPQIGDRSDRYERLLYHVVSVTAHTVAMWQSVGFCHGVLNTDNMSIVGLTLDYGPYAMMDRYDFRYVCNRNDKAGRYRFGDQPNVAYWNLTQLAKTFEPFLGKQRCDEIVREYETHYIDAFLHRMRAKLGLYEPKSEDRRVIVELVGALQDAHIDYTLFFRTLSCYAGMREMIFDLAFNPQVLEPWLDIYESRLQDETLSADERMKRMLRTNPKYILRTHLLERAYRDLLSGDDTTFQTLMHLMRNPFDDHTLYEDFSYEPPYGAGNETIACLS